MTLTPIDTRTTTARLSHGFPRGIARVGAIAFCGFTMMDGDQIGSMRITDFSQSFYSGCPRCVAIIYGTRRTA